MLLHCYSLHSSWSPCCLVPGTSLPLGSTHQHCPPCWHCLGLKAPPTSQEGTKVAEELMAARRSSSQAEGPEDKRPAASSLGPSQTV